MKRHNYLLILIFSVVVGMLIPSCAVNPVTGKSQIMFMSEEQEISLGKQYHPTVLSTFGVYENPQLQKLIQEKGVEMGKISHRPDLQYKFTILDSPVINAFAVPGGYIYLTRGILAQFNNEAELMGVLGHEMGHITARHTAQQQTRQQLAQLGLMAGMIASKEVAEFAGYAMQGMQLLFLSFSRANEREADRLGVEYATKIGYDTHKMADFFNVLNKMNMKSSHGGVPTFMSTHPDPGDRFNAVNRTTDEWQAKTPGNFAVNTNDYLNMLDGLVYGEDPRQGFVEGNTFYHPDLKFRFNFPTGWKLVNSPIQVQIVPPEGNGAMIFTLAQEKSPEAAAQKAISELQFTVLENQSTKVNGLNAFTTLSRKTTQAQTGEQQAIDLISYFIEKDGNVYAFHGIANKAQFGQFKQAFEKSMKSYSVLTEQAKLNVKPNRIRVKKIRNTQPLSSIFKYYKVPQEKYEEMALLNNRGVNDEVKSGEFIKVLGK